MKHFSGSLSSFTLLQNIPDTERDIMSVALETKLEMKYQSFRADIGTTHALCALFCGARQTPACYIVIICSKNMHKSQQDHLEKTLKERPRPLIRKYNDRFNGIKGYSCAMRKARVPKCHFWYPENG